MRAKDARAQSTIEFTFAMIIVLFLIFGLIRIFRWAGMDLAERRWTYDQEMKKPEFWKADTDGEVYRAKRINAFFRN